MNALDSWLKSGKYLPPILRDFHDQKAVFKTIHLRVQEDAGAFIKRPSWVDGQCYVIDTFLWFMAKRGYTLQRSRANLEFRNLQTDVAASIEQANASANRLLADFLKQGKP